MKKISFAVLMGLLLLAGCSTEPTSESTPGTTAPVAEQAPRYRLNYRLAEDQSWVSKDKRTETVTLTMGPDRENTTEVTTVISRKFNAGAVDRDQLVPVTMTYLDVFGEGDGGNGKFTYDSNDPSSGPGNGLEFLPGAELNLRIAPATGQIVEVTGGDALVERMMGAAEEPGKGDQLMKEQMSPDFFFVPEDSVAVGDTWTRTGQFSSGYMVDYTSTYTLKSVEGDRAVIDQETQITPIPTADGAPIPPVNLSGTATAEIAVDIHTGIVRSRNSTTSIKGTRTIPGAEGQTIPMQIDIVRYSESK